MLFAATTLLEGWAIISGVMLLLGVVVTVQKHWESRSIPPEYRIKTEDSFLKELGLTVVGAIAFPACILFFVYGFIVVKLLMCVGALLVLLIFPPCAVWVVTEKINKVLRVALVIIGGVAACPLAFIAWLFLMGVFGFIEQLSEHIPGFGKR